MVDDPLNVRDLVEMLITDTLITDYFKTIILYHVLTAPRTSPVSWILAASPWTPRTPTSPVTGIGNQTGKEQTLARPIA
jgi:hypothetical protein